MKKASSVVQDGTPPPGVLMCGVWTVGGLAAGCNAARSVSICPGVMGANVLSMLALGPGVEGGTSALGDSGIGELGVASS